MNILVILVCGDNTDHCDKGGSIGSMTLVKVQVKTGSGSRLAILDLIFIDVVPIIVTIFL